MRQTRLTALALACALPLLVACNPSPGRVFGRPAPAGRTAPAGAPVPGPGPGGTSSLPPGTYLASYIALDVRTDLPLPVVIAPTAGSFPTGTVAFVVLNKWGGLAPGPHQEEVAVLAPDDSRELARETTDFAIDPGHVFLTVASHLEFDAPEPGFYQVAVSLDQQVVARYRFLVSPDRA